MNTPTVAGRWLIGLALLCGTAAVAQDYGLDLTSDADYRPTAAVVGIGVTDPQLPPGTWDKWKVERIANGAQQAVESSGAFSTVLGPADAFELMGEDYTAVFSCQQVACLAEAAGKMRVNVLLLGQLTRKQGKVMLRLVRFTRFENQGAAEEVFAAKSQKYFEKAALDGFEKLARAAGGSALGLLKITSETPNASARLGEHLLGAVPLEQRLPPGEYTVTVRAEGFLDDELEVDIKPGKTTTLESNLVARLPAPPPEELPPVVEVFEPLAPTPPAKVSMWQRPGLYVALAGVASIAAGAALGVSAKSLETRAVDANGDGVLDITRREANAAHRDALLANILVGAGGAAVAGGAVWFFLTPGTPRAQAHSGAAMSVGVAGVLP